jgi:hypothetical protein
VLIGAVAALTSWALYGSGAGVELAQTNLSEEISLKLPALAGALLVGIAGAKWLTSESDKGLYKESVKEAGKSRYGRAARKSGTRLGVGSTAKS